MCFNFCCNICVICSNAFHSAHRQKTIKIIYHYLHHHYIYFDVLFSHIDNPGGSPHGWGFEITLRHATLDRTPLEELSARRRDRCRTKYITRKKQTSMPSAGLEPAVPVCKRPKTHTLDRAAAFLTCYLLIISGCNYQAPKFLVYQSFVKRPVTHTSRHLHLSTSPICIYSSLIYVGVGLIYLYIYVLLNFFNHIQGHVS